MTKECFTCDWFDTAAAMSKGGRRNNNAAAKCRWQAREFSLPTSISAYDRQRLGALMRPGYTTPTGGAECPCYVLITEGDMARRRMQARGTRAIDGTPYIAPAPSRRR